MKDITNRVRELTALKERRERRRLTQQTLAKELGMSTSTVNALMNNKIEFYAKVTLNKLCEYFECTPGDLLVYEEVDDVTV